MIWVKLKKRSEKPLVTDKTKFQVVDVSKKEEEPKEEIKFNLQLFRPQCKPK